MSRSASTRHPGPIVPMLPPGTTPPGSASAAMRRMASISAIAATNPPPISQTKARSNPTPNTPTTSSVRRPNAMSSTTGATTFARPPAVGSTTIGATTTSQPPRIRKLTSASGQVEGRARTATNEATSVAPMLTARAARPLGRTPRGPSRPARSGASRRRGPARNGSRPYRQAAARHGRSGSSGGTSRPTRICSRPASSRISPDSAPENAGPSRASGGSGGGPAAGATSRKLTTPSSSVTHRSAATSRPVRRPGGPCRPGARARRRGPRAHAGTTDRVAGGARARPEGYAARADQAGPVRLVDEWFGVRERRGVERFVDLLELGADLDSGPRRSPRRRRWPRAAHRAHALRWSPRPSARRPRPAGSRPPPRARGEASRDADIEVGRRERAGIGRGRGLVGVVAADPRTGAGCAAGAAASWRARWRPHRSRSGPGRDVRSAGRRSSAAPHDGHVSASPVVASAEHHGQMCVRRLDPEGVSSTMARMLPRDPTRPEYPIGPGSPGYAHGSGYSHSMVAGGLDEMSYTTRFTPGTSLTIAAADLAQDVVRELRPVGRHAVLAT